MKNVDTAIGFYDDDEPYITFPEIGRLLGVKESDMELFVSHMVDFSNEVHERGELEA